MKVYYSADGTIHEAVWDRDAFTFLHSHNFPLSTLDIDEIEDNRALCQTLAHGLNSRDEDGNRMLKLRVNAGGNIVDENSKPIQVVVDADKARLSELEAKPTLSAAEKDEALRLLLGNTVRNAAAIRSIH